MHSLVPRASSSGTAYSAAEPFYNDADDSLTHGRGGSSSSSGGGGGGGGGGSGARRRGDHPSGILRRQSSSYDGDVFEDDETETSAATGGLSMAGAGAGAGAGREGTSGAPSVPSAGSVGARVGSVGPGGTRVSFNMGMEGAGSPFTPGAAPSPPKHGLPGAAGGAGSPTQVRAMSLTVLPSQVRMKGTKNRRMWSR